MAADQTTSPSEAPTVPVVATGEEPTLPLAGRPAGGTPAAAAAPTVATPAPPAATPAAPQAPEPAPVRAPEKPAERPPAKWLGRVIVPGATGPGQKKAAAPPAPTQRIARYTEPGATVIGPRARPVLRQPAPPRRRRSGASRFFTAVFALVLILAVPVVSAYVAYKLASGENPFEWPPSMDLSRVF